METSIEMITLAEDGLGKWNNQPLSTCPDISTHHSKIRVHEHVQCAFRDFVLPGEGPTKEFVSRVVF